ncbi:MAG: zf-TFIIB domain-containing protein [Nitrospirota bacterium]
MYQTKKCEHCGKKINRKYRICPLCGAGQSDEVELIPAVCPRCKVNLEIYIQKGEEYDICPSCGGLWLDRDEFRRATAELSAYRDKEVKGDYKQGSASDSVKYLPCVRCSKIMNRKNFAKISGVIVDECANHGVWLDAGELEKIRNFVADGGLERAQDREIEKNRNELRDLATRVEQTAFTHKIIHFWNLKRWLFGG